MICKNRKNWDLEKIGTFIIMECDRILFTDIS